MFTRTSCREGARGGAAGGCVAQQREISNLLHRLGRNPLLLICRRFAGLLLFLEGFIRTYGRWKNRSRRRISRKWKKGVPGRGGGERGPTLGEHVVCTNLNLVYVVFRNSWCKAERKNHGYTPIILVYHATHGHVFDPRRRLGKFCLFPLIGMYHREESEIL